MADQSTVKFDQYGYGVKWRRRTRATSWHCGDASHLRRLCLGRQHQCSFRKEPHLILQGSDKNGRLLSAQAQIYPNQLCQHFVAALVTTAEDTLTCRILRLGTG